MSDTVISEEAFNNARALVGKCRPGKDTFEAVARFIQEVSDAAKVVHAAMDGQAWSLAQYRGTLASFILPEPVDPLEEKAQEIADEFRLNLSAMPTVEKALYAALRRGIELAKAGQP